MKNLLPHQHIDKKLLLRLGIFLVIGVVMFGIVVHDVLSGDLAVWLAAGGFLLGIIVGYFLGRILRVKWHQTKQKAVMEMDIMGFVAIGIYLAFRFGENWVFGQFLTGVALSTLSLAILSGLLLGRLFGLRMSILKLIEQNKPGTEA